jgi:hypothetical protein
MALNQKLKVLLSANLYLVVIGFKLHITKHLEKIIVDQASLMTQ